MKKRGTKRKKSKKVAERTCKKADVEATNPFDEIPEDAIAKIFSFLNARSLCQVSSVCKTWRKLAQSAYVWEARSIDLRPDLHDFRIFRRMRPLQAFQSMLVSGFRNVHEVYVHEHVAMLLPALFQSLSSLPFWAPMQLKIVDIRVAEHYLTDEHLVILSTHCMSLDYFAISECTGISDLGLAEFVSNCRMLRQLHVENVQGDMTGDCSATAFALGKFCRSLERLTIPTADISSLMYVLTRCKQLKMLAVFMKTENLATGGYARLAQAANAQLEELRLHLWDVPITDQELIDLMTECRVIKYLQLANTYRITPLGLEIALARAANLQLLYVQLAFLTAATIDTISLCCPFLQELSVWFPASTDPTLPDSGTPDSDRLLTNLSKTMPKLTSMELHCESGISEVSLKTFLSARKITMLMLENCNWLTDVGMGHIASFCSELRIFSIKSNLAVSDEGIIQVIKKCRKLDDLDVTECPKLTNAVLGCIREYGDNLINFEFSSGQFSEDAIMSLAMAKEHTLAMLAYKFKLLAV
mmetsp:Transcript_958/g.1471  ORF Transcript_958/g.1471 Transcript_958/m.1471 type:complete len:529 (-) Transcript_958:133-1719(-)|eukprot:CAMPEP_0184647302 /NCGR_PEP_ID=MMETSP0308-20130426/4195_1 /TAXON_ID=38269 /ORGANISM="Gloeochaete witrockiana, Strain SAG 46.84" /LENGTH=528 /DNA_ID=CAMNT_0027078135 /DNA_START=102 /DNA_END=1688 /DNA_ORIENTATION=+